MTRYSEQNSRYVRRPKFIFYIFTACVGLAVGCLAAVVANEYSDKSNVAVTSESNGLKIDASKVVSCFAFTAVACFFTSLLFGAAMILDCLYPERKEASAIQWAWKAGAAAATVLVLAASLATTIIIATKSISTRVSGKAGAVSPLGPDYNDLAFATVIVCWIEWLLTLMSTIVMWRFYARKK